ncbi:MULTISPECIES: DUF378 domain-containing protein [Chengkuizengella]|uniref:DUF378 domain-containing protein n=1 Tax=Chengkuizengella TaxID=2026172 RepID=UPI00138957F6|nr:DUF378 domain-containing protein [Chengkuizengella sediminis]NDI36588.1 DUF378 domain-containing protein [Chengkuizengella sediminis]
MKTLNVIALLLVIIGGLNWLLFGLFQWDLVGGLFGGMDSGLSRTIYVIVGIAAVYSFSFFNNVTYARNE